MKSISRKLLLSLSTFLFALVALFGATFAWFTEADQATVNGFNLTINAGNNLLLKDPSGAFVTTLTQQNIIDLYNAQHATQGELNPSETIAYQFSFLKLSPLTSKDGKTFYLEQKTDTYADPARLYAPGAAGMFYFDINITVRALVPLDVHLLQGTPAMLVSTENKAGAYRMSFYNSTTLLRIWESGAPVDEWDSLMEAGNFITPSGTALGLDLSGQTTTSALYNYESASANSTVYSKLITLDAYSGITPLSGTHANDRVITVRIWIEGWDSLTTDALKPDQLTVNLKFIGVTV